VSRVSRGGRIRRTKFSDAILRRRRFPRRTPRGTTCATVAGRRPQKEKTTPARPYQPNSRESKVYFGFSDNQSKQTKSKIRPSRCLIGRVHTVFSMTRIPSSSFFFVPDRFELSRSLMYFCYLSNYVQFNWPPLPSPPINRCSVSNRRIVRLVLAYVCWFGTSPFESNGRMSQLTTVCPVSLPCTHTFICIRVQSAAREQTRFDTSYLPVCRNGREVWGCQLSLRDVPLKLSATVSCLCGRQNTAFLPAILPRADKQFGSEYESTYLVSNVIAGAFQLVKPFRGGFHSFRTRGEHMTIRPTWNRIDPGKCSDVKADNVEEPVPSRASSCYRNWDSTVNSDRQQLSWARTDEKAYQQYTYIVCGSNKMGRPRTLRDLR